MKTYSIILSLLQLSVSVIAQNTDLPHPDANLQTISSGSYVIAMDNTNQLNASGDFNLKAYGLVVYLLNNNVKVKWSIRAGKIKDGTDFTATAEQLKPTLVAGGTSKDFKGGPFIIEAGDTTGVGALIDAFYTANALTGNNRPKIYRLTTAANNVDIRYNLAGFHPKAAILTDGGNQNIHIAFMAAASIPAGNYATSTGLNLASSCYTFATEPHNTSTGTAVNNTIAAIRQFVMKGGNFLAQCAAIENYENNPLGRFQTSTGITVTNDNINTNVNYDNADLSFVQFDGLFNASLTGSVKNWEVLETTSNNEHHHATGFGANSNSIGASVSKLFFGKGGLVFYLGNHNYSTGSAVGINGIRMYMNAFLTPSNTDCPSLLGYSYLPVKLSAFGGYQANKTNNLKWQIEENETVKRFDIEKSEDARNYTTCAVVLSTTETGSKEYFFDEKPSSDKTWYRLKITDQQGKTGYSATIVIGTKEIAGNEIKLKIVNPVKTDAHILFETDAESSFIVNTYNSQGYKVFSKQVNCFAGMNRIIIPSPSFIVNGIYEIEMIDTKTNKRYTVRALKL